MDEREKLIEYLDTHCIDSCGETWKIADFILSDRKRIVEPLVKLLKENILLSSKAGGKTSVNKAIDQTLKNAGVE